MYIPKNFRQENLEEIKSFLQQNSFGILVSSVDGKPWATHIPLLLGQNEKGIDVLQGHIARGNKQWREFDKYEQVLAIFTGPHAYISSSWYDHENVPTWNYVALHVYGELRIIEDDELLASLKKMVDKYEANSTLPVKLENMSEKFLQSELRGIVGFEIRIREIQAAYKLSQNRDAKNKELITGELEKKGDTDAVRIAGLIKSCKS